MGWQATGFRHLSKLVKWQLTISRQPTDSRYLQRSVNNYFAKSLKKILISHVISWVSNYLLYQNLI